MGLPVDDLCYFPATELARLIRDRKLSPVELVDAFLNRIERVNPVINAYCTVAHDLARQAARAAEDSLMRGGDPGPLHGVPVAIKDLTPTAGIKTTYGSVIFKDNVPTKDSVFVERVKDAGAILLGKTNTPEFGHKGTTDNLLFGATRNPWNTGLVAGGSSGGSAAAVAAGMAPLAEGSDGGGSVRIPASICGVYGLKPTYGRIPIDNSISKFSHHAPFLHYGVITRTVADAALFLSVVAGPDDRDPFSLPDTGENYSQALDGDVKGLKVAYSPDLGYFEIESGVKAVVEDAVKVFPQMGCELEVVDPGFENPFETVEKTFNLMWSVYYSSFYRGLLPRWKEHMSPGVVAMIKAGENVSAVDYKKLELHRTAIYNKIQGVFERYDLLITPTLAVPPFQQGIPGPSQINGKAVNPNSGWILTYPFNLTGHPAASIPCGFTADNLPVGLQIVARRFAESLILKVSAAFEKARPWTHKKPVLG